MIDQATVDRIISAAGIVDVVSEFVNLRRRGVNYIGLCPFHPDKSPSFSVSPVKNICKCFSCGEGGDPVHFVMKHEQLNFHDALLFLAKKYHIEVEEKEPTDEERHAQSDRESMFIVNNWAQQHFTSRLFEHEEGKMIGLSYFNERGFREDIVRKFRLGYSLGKRDDLYQAAIKSGYQKTYLEKTGLVSFYEDGKPHDRFRGRVIFPVHTLSGKVVAFGGRILGKNEKTAKYLNSPESDIYHKSNELYGIYFARNAIRKENKCYLVEGYTDVISMHQTGVENVVASCGTALTQGQIRMIHRLTDNVTVLYDGDTAGINAALKGIDLFLEEGMNVKVLLLPNGEDPDSFTRKKNAFEFTSYIHQHETDFIRFKTQLLLSEAGEDPIKRAVLVSDVIRSIAVIPDGIVRAEYLKECSHLLDVREQVLIDALNKERAKRPRTLWKKAPETLPDTPPQLPPDREDLSTYPTLSSDKRKMETSPFKAHEEMLLRYIIHSGEQILSDSDAEDGEPVTRLAEYICSELGLDDITFSVPVHQRIMDEVLAHCSEPGFVASRYFLSHSDPEISRTAIHLTDDKYPLSCNRIWETKEELLSGKATLKTLQQKGKNGLLSYEEKKFVQEQQEKERQLREQIEIFERTLCRDLFALKEAHVRQKITDITNKIKHLQMEGKIDETIKLLKEQSLLNKLKIELSKELGERIILKMRLS
ncbi:MAG: DNA primase [Tannerella sp.]|jgi:DNA primase|nr:DNA primase [Tannerella sp.]